ncbi:hypothetical protein Goari_024172 [Gossypium aridum]|uniref:Uncharacterized protein n=1 Tax=Gossypium aridum TaxID=34290 RepID=A0A7J8X5C4_GOSAI|nr:hypothetical protein [Gossypium aridum]
MVYSTAAEVKACSHLYGRFWVSRILVEGDVLTIIKKTCTQVNKEAHLLAEEGRRHVLPRIWVEELPREVKVEGEKNRRAILGRS